MQVVPGLPSCNVTWWAAPPPTNQLLCPPDFWRRVSHATWAAVKSLEVIFICFVLLWWFEIVYCDHLRERNLCSNIEGWACARASLRHIVASLLYVGCKLATAQSMQVNTRARYICSICSLVHSCSRGIVVGKVDGPHFNPVHLCMFQIQCDKHNDTLVCCHVIETNGRPWVHAVGHVHSSDSLAVWTSCRAVPKHDLASNVNVLEMFHVSLGMGWSHMLL